jgi:hypothetical protein
MNMDKKSVDKFVGKKVKVTDFWGESITGILSKYHTILENQRVFYNVSGSPDLLFTAQNLQKIELI